MSRPGPWIVALALAATTPVASWAQTSAAGQAAAPQAFRLDQAIQYAVDQQGGVEPCG